VQYRGPAFDQSLKINQTGFFLHIKLKGRSGKCLDGIDRIKTQEPKTPAQMISFPASAYPECPMQ